MGRVLVISVVLVMLGAAVATPGAVAAGSDNNGGADTVEYSVFGTDANSPVSHLFALKGDETLSDDDEEDDGDDEDDEEDGEDDEDDEEDGEDDEDDEEDGEDDEDDEEDGEDDEDDEEDGEDDEDDEEDGEDDEDDEEDGEDDEDDEEDGEDDEVDSEDNDNQGDDEDWMEENEADEEGDDGNGDSGDQRNGEDWMNEIVDSIADVTTPSHPAPEQPTTEAPSTKATTTPTQTATPTRSPTPTPSQTVTPTQTATPTRSPTPTPSQTTTLTEMPAPAAFDVSNPSVDQTSMTPGETLRVVVEVENGGEQAGTFTGQLRVDGEVVDTASSTIDAGEMERVAFEHRIDDPGEYEVAVDEMDIATVTVTEPTTERGETTRGATAEEAERLVQVVDAEVPADWVRVDTRTNLRATVVNTANRTADQTLSVTIDGEVVGNETVSLQPYERRVVSIEFVAADGDISVEGFDVGTIDVREQGNDPVTGTVESATGSSNDANPEFFILVALLGLLLGGVGFFGVTRR